VTVIESNWDQAVPDIPRWVETRSMLLHGATTVGTPEGGLVIGNGRDLAGVVGLPIRETITEALGMLDPGAELLVPPETVHQVLALLPPVLAERAIIHAAPPRLAPPEDGAVEIRPVDASELGWLSSHLAPEAKGASWAAVKRIEGEVVAMCTAGPITETLWDPGIDTLEQHRRKGYARSCFLALAAHLRPLTPIWGAVEDNTASLAMAASLGFEPVDELWVLTLPG
jgi:GNAT superfamily N-acetyltransferase